MFESDYDRNWVKRFLAADVVSIMCFALLVCLLVANHFLLKPHLTLGDSLDFMKIANSMIEHQAFSKFEVDGKPLPDTIRTPGYPVLLAVAKIVFGDPVRFVRIFQPLVLFFSIWLIFREIRSRFGPATANLTILFLLAIPGYFAFSPAVLSESVAFSSLVAAATLGMKDRPGKARAILCGLLAGYGTLCRTNMLFVFGPVFLWQWHFRKNRIDAALITLGVVVTLTPWVARNYATFGKLTPAQPAERHQFLTLYQETYFGIDIFEKHFTPEMERNGFKARNDSIHAKVGVPEGIPVTVYFSNEEHLPSLELQNRVSDEISKWESELRAEHGALGMYLRRLVYIVPPGWVTKNYPVPFREVLGPALLTANVVILILGFLSWKFCFGYRLALLPPCYFLVGLIAGYFPASLVLIPTIVFAFVLIRKPGTDPMMAISLAIMVHYLLLPMVVHIEARYVRPMTPFMCLLAAMTALRIMDRLYAARTDSRANIDIEPVSRRRETECGALQEQF